MPDERRWGQHYGLYLPRTLLAWQSEPAPSPIYESEGTFLLVDISGFTAMSELLAEKGKVGSEEVTEILNAAFTELLDIVMLDGGDLLRFGGDALFNLYVGADHAARACRSALDMRDALDEFQKTRSPSPLQMSVGIASGPVTAVLAGRQSKELMFVGPTASSVVSLQGAASPGEILISGATRDALDDASVVGDPVADGFLLIGDPDVDDAEEDDAAVDVSGVDLSQFVPARLRNHLSLTFNEGEHRPATIAFIKFTGTDDVYETDGIEALGDKLDELVAVTQAAAERYGVCFLASDVDEDGGKLLISSGVPERAPGHGERIVNALRDIVDSDPPLPVHAGVARGHVFAGDLGARFRRVYTVMGDTVNLAARLAAKAGAGEIYVTARALDRSADAFATEEIDPIELKGKAKPVAPLRIGALMASDDSVRGTAMFPLFGREAEIATITTAAADAIAGSGTTVEVTGRPGMGKTRIVVEALESLGPGFGVLWVTCERYESATPYHAAGQLLRTALGIKEADATQLGEALTDAIRRDAPDQTQWIPLLADVVGASVDSTPEVDALAEQFRQQALHSAVAGVLETLLPEPTAMVVEDSHWADESSRLLFGAISDDISDRPWVLLALRSSDEGEPLATDIATLEIGPLAPEAAVQLVSAVAGEATPLPFAEEIARRAGGNPFYIVELARSVTSFDTGDLPETVEAVTLARIDRLSQNDRRLLRYASVFGETFAIDLLADALPDVAQNIDDASMWNRLDEFLDTSSMGKVRFRQEIVRDVAYAGLPFRRRIEIHLAIAEALERRARRRPERFAEAMSLHFDRAENWDKSWRYSTLAGDRAAKKLAHVEAIRIYRRALRAADQLEIEGAELRRIHEAIGDAAEHLGLLEDAETAYDCCITEDEAPSVKARLLRKKALLHVARGQMEDAGRLLEESLATVADSGDAEADETKIETMIAIAGMHFRQADYNATVEWCTKAIEAAGNSYKKEAAHAYYMRSVAYTHLSGFDGHADGTAALAVYEELDDLVGQTNVLNNLGYDAYYRGDWDEAVDWWTRSVETGTRSGDIVRTASSIHNLGEIFLDQGHYEDVEERLRRALRIWQGSTFAIGIGLAHANLARLYTRTGRIEAAEAELDIARKEFAEAGADAYVLEEVIRRSEWLIYAGRPQEALELAVATIANNEEVQGTEVSRASLHRLAAYSLAAMGRHEPACEHIDASLELARTAGSDYELAQTLEAALRTEGADVERRETEMALETKLGIVARPWLPLEASHQAD